MLCRICLSNAVTVLGKDISELKVRKGDSFINSTQILSFCLDIQVPPKSEYRLLCHRCFDRIVQYFKFKTLAQENDAQFRKAEGMDASDDEENMIKLEIDDENCSRDIKIEKVLDENAGTCIENTKDKEKSNHEICVVKIEAMPLNSSNEMQEEYLDVDVFENDGQDENPSSSQVKVDEKDQTSENSLQEEKDDVKWAQPYVPSNDDGSKERTRKTKRNQDGTITCLLCNSNKKFIDKKSVVNHRKEEHGFLCHFCSMKFAFHNQMVIHMRQHTQEKPYQCPKCPNRYPTAFKLKRHDEHQHKGIRSFRCFVCDKRFSRKINLKMHKLTHTGERNFECYVCGKRFSLNHNLRVHLKNVHKLIIETKKPLAM